MYLRIIAFALVGLAVAGCTSTTENTLGYWANEYRRSRSDAPALVAATATLKTHGGRHYLAFHLTNVSKQVIRVRPYSLPWGSSLAVRLAAFTTDGQRLQNWYPAGDPAYEDPVAIAPGQTLSGERPIAANVTNIDTPRKRDTIVLWSYDMFLAPSLNPSVPQYTAICTGAVVIPGHP